MKQRLLYTLAFLFATLQTFAQTYTYDSNKRLTKVVYDNGTTIIYTFDALGNRMTKKVTGATSTTYTITVAVTPSGSGTVTGSGTYSSGTTIELNAIPNAGYEFLKWSDGVTDNPRSVSVTNNMNYTAQFKESTVIPDLLGDIVVDGKVNQLDLNALVDAYITNTQVTQITDLDTDGSLTIADITKLLGIINDNNSTVNNNGHMYVDLGLPSGTLWATCNVGATMPEETGDFYAWGETETKDVYSWETYKWCNGSVCNNSNQTLTKYGVDGAWGVNDGITTLELSDDVAHTKWGGDWHIPTEEDILELINYCESKWETVNGVKGRTFTASNGNSIFLPATGSKEQTEFYSGVGQYWTSSLGTSGGHSTNASHMEFNRTEFVLFEGELYGTLRYYGLSVRPVITKNQNDETASQYMNHDLVDLGLPSGTLWATCNVGANSPEESGCYFAWGEISGNCDGKSVFDWKTYKYNHYNSSNGSGSLGECFIKYNYDSEYGYNGYTDELTVLDSADDAASVIWGGEWRMPTRSEVSELFNKNYTSWMFTTQNGIQGFVCTSLVEGYTDRSIFFPAVGGMYWDNSIDSVDEYASYWTSSLNFQDPHNASVFEMKAYNGKKGTTTRERKLGLNIRPVVSFDAIVK